MYIHYVQLLFIPGPAPILVTITRWLPTPQNVCAGVIFLFFTQVLLITSFVRTAGEWWLLNDSRVSVVSGAFLSSLAARFPLDTPYMAFYCCSTDDGSPELIKPPMAVAAQVHADNVSAARQQEQQLVRRHQQSKKKAAGTPYSRSWPGRDHEDNFDGGFGGGPRFVM